MTQQPVSDSAARLLERLDSLIDPVHLASLGDLYASCWRYEPIPHLPVVVDFAPAEWPMFDFQQIQDDQEAMLLSELRRVYAGCLLRDDRLPSVRANYGTSIIPSLFGCEVRTFANALPVALPLRDTDRIRAVIEEGVPDSSRGQGAKVLDMVARFRNVFAEYPNLNSHVHIDMADIQGPFDAAEIIWGSEILLAMYDEPDLVHGFLELVTETIRRFILEHQRIDGEPFDGPCGIWGGLGRVCVREDASVNLGLPQYEEFVKPYTQRLLDEFGGCVHWCGDGKAWWRSLINMNRLSAVNPYQGEFYDAVEMHETCKDAGVGVFQWTRPLEAQAREAIRTGFSLITWASDLDEAKQCYDEVVRNTP